MTDQTPPSDHPSRRPAAIFVGGQRRRLVRRSGSSRLYASSARDTGSEDSTTSMLANAIQAGMVIDRKPFSSGNFRHEERRPGPTTPSKHHCTSIGCTHSGVQLRGQPCLSGGRDVSPISTAPKMVTEDKRSHGLFDSLKSRDRSRTATSQPCPAPTSPLPPLTPSKAAQVLGLPANTPTVDSPRGSHDDAQGIGVNVGAPVRGGLRKQSSMPMLTKFKEVTARYTKFKEEDMEPELPRAQTSKQTLKQAEGNKKLTKKLGFLPFLAPHSKSTPNLELPTAPEPVFNIRKGTDRGHRYYSSPYVPPTGSQPVLESPTRRTRKKQPKTLHRMSPITETSHDELRNVYRDHEHTSELDVISEYEFGHPQSNVPTYPLSRHAFNMAAKVKYELADDDLSPDEFEEEAIAEKNTMQEYQDMPIDLSKKKWQSPETVPVRGPLQSTEDHFQRLARKNLKEHNLKIKGLNATKIEIDAEVAALKASHEKMKTDFEESKKRAAAQDEMWHHHQCHAHDRSDDSEDNDDDDDLVSLRSSINLDEEPTVHEAKVMTFIKVPPGTVKLVNIPPRRKKPGPPAPPVTTSGASAITPRLKSNEAPQVKANVSKLQHATRGSSLEHGHGHKPVVFGRTENLQPNITRPEPEDFARHSKVKKPKMPRNESRLLVEDWIIRSPGPSEQRPVSERIDEAVLADQQIPPAPFPKEHRKK